MTENQKKLLQFVSNYRLKYANSPTLREITAGIGVFDNKSVLGIITALVNYGYLKKENKKSRSILLTDKALNFLGVYSFPIQYQEWVSILGQLRQSVTFVKDSVSVSLPAYDFIGYGDGTIKSNGTNLLNNTM
jgi:hypothetical protein